MWYTQPNRTLRPNSTVLHNESDPYLREYEIIICTISYTSRSAVWRWKAVTFRGNSSGAKSFRVRHSDDRIVLHAGCCGRRPTRIDAPPHNGRGTVDNNNNCCPSKIFVRLLCVYLWHSHYYYCSRIRVYEHCWRTAIGFPNILKILVKFTDN